VKSDWDFAAEKAVIIEKLLAEIADLRAENQRLTEWNRDLYKADVAITLARLEHEKHVITAAEAERDTYKRQAEGMRRVLEPLNHFIDNIAECEGMFDGARCNARYVRLKGCKWEPYCRWRSEQEDSALSATAPAGAEDGVGEK
jgi:hypothetical protein